MNEEKLRELDPDMSLTELEKELINRGIGVPMEHFLAYARGKRTNVIEEPNIEEQVQIWPPEYFGEACRAFCNQRRYLLKIRKPLTPVSCVKDACRTACPLIVKEKLCLNCMEVKPVGDFQPAQGTFDGLLMFCRDCFKKIDGAAEELIEKGL